MSETPEWQSLAGRRQEIEDDPLLDAEAKASLISSWKEMAQSSRQLLEKQPGFSADAAVGNSLAYQSLLVPVLTLTAAFGVFWAIGGLEQVRYDWPVLTVDRSGAAGAGRSVVTSGEHPGDGVSLSQRLETLEAKLAANPQDVQGWVLLARTQAAMSNYNDSAASLRKALALVPGHPGLLADIADMTAMANGRQMAGEPLKLIQQALQNDPNHEKSLALAATAAEQAGDDQLAQQYWQRLAQAQQLRAEQTAGPKAPEAQVFLKVPVQISQAAFKVATEQAVLFVFVKEEAGPGMPLAVVKKPMTQLNADVQPISITTADLIGGKTLSDLPDPLYLQARLAMSGSVQPTKDDWQSEWLEVRAGQDMYSLLLELKPGS